MSDDADNNKKERKPLTLRKTETGQVKQSFSHGRSKTVVVETKRRRISIPKKAGVADGKEGLLKKSETKIEVKKEAPKAAQKKPVSEDAEKKGAVLRTLSPEEQKARSAALAIARKNQEARKKKEALERAAREKREAEERQKLEAERARKVEEEKKLREAEELKRAEEVKKADPEAEKRALLEKAADASAAAAAVAGEDDIAGRKKVKPKKEDGDMLSRLGGRLKTKRQYDEGARSAKPREESKRRSGKLTIAKALEDDERQRSLASVRRAREREKAARRARGEKERVIREVVIPETITVSELANRMAMRAVELIKILMQQGQMVTGSAILDADTAQVIAEDLGHTVKRVAEADVEMGLEGDEDKPEDLKPRPPVVTIMGHVDHGKTSLLDALRQTDVVGGEAGGITQHIGAYQITVAGDSKVTFLDTPGHAAFTQMRARGAEVTDIVIIVVSADDSVMPQTKEAISHAKAAGVPIIVAINKIDKPDANPDKVKTDLLQEEIQVESLGGDIQDIEVSAMAKTNLDKLLEAIHLQAELLELKANPNRQAVGAVVEAQLDKGRGPVVTLLVQKGTLRRGDILVCGAEWGKVRALHDDRGNRVDEAIPSMPIEVLGLSGVPEPGDQFAVVDSEARAREIAEFRQRQRRQKAIAKSSGTSLESMMAQIRDSQIQELPIVLKGDVQGSVEAIISSLEKMATEEVRVRVLHSGVGGISESDVILAEATSAPVIGFNVRANKQAREVAERSGVEIRYYSVIYDLLDDMKGILSGMLAPEVRETFLGNAEILEVFNISKFGRVAGCRVVEGVVRRGAKVRLIRDDVVIHEGELSQLKRFKDDVQEVPMGQECGMSFANYEDLKAGDTIECFAVEEIKRSLD